MFFVTNLPRLLLNLYELFNVDDMISCGVQFYPPGEHFVSGLEKNNLFLNANIVNISRISFCIYKFLSSVP